MSDYNNDRTEAGRAYGAHLKRAARQHHEPVGPIYRPPHDLPTHHLEVLQEAADIATQYGKKHIARLIKASFPEVKV